MSKPDWRYGADLANFAKVAAGFAVAGAVILALGVAVLFHALNGGTSLGLLSVLCGLWSLSIGGRLFSGYRHFKQNPQLGRGLDFSPLRVDPGRPYRTRLFYTGLGLITVGTFTAYEGGSILAGSVSFSKTVGILAVIAAAAFFVAAGSCFWKYYKNFSQVIR